MNFSRMSLLKHLMAQKSKSKPLSEQLVTRLTHPISRGFYVAQTALFLTTRTKTEDIQTEYSNTKHIKNSNGVSDKSPLPQCFEERKIL